MNEGLRRVLEVCGEGFIQWASCPEKNPQSAKHLRPEQVTLTSSVFVQPVAGLYRKLSAIQAVPDYRWTEAGTSLGQSFAGIIFCGF